MPAEQLAQIFEVLEGGAQVAGEVVQFPIDAAGAAAETALAGEGVSTVVQLGNGAAAEVSQLTVVEGGATTTTGVGLLAMDVGVAGAAVAPALGILAGVGLYNLAPEFWTDVSDALVAAGQTVGGKVRAFLDGNTKQAYLSQETIEIFKEAFIDAGLFDGEFQLEQEYFTNNYLDGKLSSELFTNAIGIDSNFLQNWQRSCQYKTYLQSVTIADLAALYSYMQSVFTPASGIPANLIFSVPSSWNNGPGTIQWDYYTAGTDGWQYTTYHQSDSNYYYEIRSKYSNWVRHTRVVSYYPSKYNNNFTKLTEGLWIQDGGWLSYNNSTAYLRIVSSQGSWVNQHKWALAADLLDIDTVSFPGVWTYPNFGTEILSEYVQQDAVLPDSRPIPDTYPGWHQHAEDCPCNPEVKMYPIELPVNNPDANQQQAQNPDPDPEPSPWLEWLIDNLIQPAHNTDPDPSPQPEPEPDPDPQPEPEPVPEDEPADVPPDPPDPNPVPPDAPIPVIPVLPDTVDSNAMFTVYSPSLSQLNSFGAWLWNSSIIEAILRMWQNPLDGIIAFMKVYATPSTGTSRNIQVGYLDSGVSAPVVTSQFVTVDCGTVQVNENKHNATDYTPYVSLHLYLPFIGIVELDPDEFMDGSINVKYSIDVYTGTCLAEVRCTRSVDMPNATILYTFSGNASQQLPLTSANFAGALSSLVSAVGGGIMIASGGAVGGIAGAAALGHSLTHEMVHVGHSGALSSNAGIMASRKPYLIMSRRHGYDANNYASEYGYPANKAVYLGNCSGYTRVKAGHLKCKADAAEKDEIMALLQKGVIL